MNPRSRRSRTGCETCRSKHVRCDEKRPNCTRCIRLNLSCTWLQGRRSLKDQRRGYGPVKSRAGFHPKQILPASSLFVDTALPLLCEPGDGASGSLTPAGQVQHAFGEPLDLPLGGSGVTMSPSGGSSLYHLRPEIDKRSPIVGTDEWWSRWALEEDENLPFLSSPNEPPNDGFSEALDPYFSIGSFDHVFASNGNDTENLHSLFGMLLPPSASLSGHHVALPNSMTLTVPEHEALRHYQTTYSLYRTTKDPNWSTHKVLLRLGAQNPMIMHFLLAVSINDYSLRKSQYSSSSEAECHFQEGARLLIEGVKLGAEMDYVSTMAAYFFIYLYMSKRKSTAPQRLTQLSLAVMDYVEKNELNIRCIGLGKSPDDSAAPAASTNDNSLLARLIMWTFDEDVKCSFQSTGGHLARHLTRHSARTKDVYEASRNALANHWGAEYPNSQQLDDDLNSTVLEFLWGMMPLWQDINDLPHESDLSMELRSRIEQSFCYLDQKFSSVFRLSADVATKPRPRVLINADYDVVLFNALRIYYFRSTISDLSMETPLYIQDALKSLLAIIQRTFASRGTELHDRLQWPLFLAGIETDDPIYKDWIICRLTSDRVATALQRTVDAQSLCGKRLMMSEIRQMLYDTEDDTLLQSGSSFLDAFQEF